MSFMSFQNIKKALFVGTIALLNFNAQAQIEKGVSTLGGEVSIYNIKTNTGTPNGSTSSNQFGLSPSYGRFITDRIMIKGTLTSTIANGQSTFNNEIDYNFRKTNLQAELRYYFTPKDKVKLFAGASAGFEMGSNQYKQSGSNFNGKFHSGNYSVFAGFDKFLNNEIALEGTIGFRHSILGYPFGFENLVNMNNFGIDLSITNFVKLNADKTEMKGLLDEGRTIIGGNFSVNHFTATNPGYSANLTKTNGTYAIMNAEYGRLVKKGLLVGAKSQLNISRGDTRLLNQFSIIPYMQYFIPINDRFMLHAKVEAQATFINKNTLLDIKGGIGATYFLNKNVALNFDVLNINKRLLPDNNIKSTWFSSNVGLRFFLK
jgi:outer membrane protein W